MELRKLRSKIKAGARSYKAGQYDRAMFSPMHIKKGKKSKVKEKKLYKEIPDLYFIRACRVWSGNNTTGT